MRLVATVAGLALAITGLNASAETIRIAIGTQDTTINCATGGLLIRELGLLDKYLPHDGKYKDAKYEVEWKNFTSGAPLTNEMVAGKLDFGAMADFPGSFNGVAHLDAGKRSLFISVLSGSIRAAATASWCRPPPACSRWPNSRARPFPCRSPPPPTACCCARSPPRAGTRRRT
jgi:NitT/TauT family transport system substrate-binding protein